MKSFVIAKYLLGSEPLKPIDLDKFRLFIEHYSQFNWKEDVNIRYANIQKERQEGKRGDNMEARHKMDFYFQYTKSGEYAFAGSYDKKMEIINIDYEKFPSKESIDILYLFAKYLEADLYDGNVKMTLNNVNEYFGISDVLKQNIINKISELHGLFNMLLTAYPSRESSIGINEPRFLIVSWDYSIESLVNLKNIVIWDLFEAIPRKESRLISSLGMKYAEAFEFYLGEVIIKNEPNYSWSIFQIGDVENMILKHVSQGPVLIPGAVILKLLASNGEYDIVNDIRNTIRKAF